ENYFISEGNHRCLAAHLMGERSIRTRIIEITDDEAVEAFERSLRPELEENNACPLTEGEKWFLNWSSKLTGKFPLVAPSVAAVAGVILSIIFISQPGIAIFGSIITHLVVNIFALILNLAPAAIGDGGKEKERADEKKLSRVVEVGEVKTTSARVLDFKVRKVLIWSSMSVFLATIGGFVYFLMNADPVLFKLSIALLAVGGIAQLLGTKSENAAITNLEKAEQSKKSVSGKIFYFKPKSTYFMLLLSIVASFSLITASYAVNVPGITHPLLAILLPLAFLVNLIITYLLHEIGHGLVAHLSAKKTIKEMRYAVFRVGLLFRPRLALTEEIYREMPEWKYRFLCFAGPLANFIFFIITSLYLVVNPVIPLTVSLVGLPLVYFLIINGVSVLNLAPFMPRSDGKKIWNWSVISSLGDGIPKETGEEIFEHLRSKNIAVDHIIEKGNENSAKIDENGRLNITIIGKNKKHVEEVKKTIDELFIWESIKKKAAGAKQEYRDKFLAGDVGPGVIMSFKGDLALTREEERFLWTLFHRKHPDQCNRDTEEFGRFYNTTVRQAIGGGEGKKRVLDLGCGPEGKAIKSLKKDHGDSIEAYGINYEITSPPDRDVTLVEDDIREMPFEDEYFDVIYEYNVMMYCMSDEETKEMLAEVMRVLKPGGTFIFGSMRMYSQADIEDMLKSLGVEYEISGRFFAFIITKKVSTTEPPAGTAKKDPPAGTTKWLKKLTPDMSTPLRSLVVSPFVEELVYRFGLSTLLWSFCGIFA
ncbi:MAG: methyltransferase domain-containing protein, partial [Candidatus Omnitrophota bacterium]